MFHFASEINAYNKLQYPFQFACSFANELRKLISYTMNLFYKKIQSNSHHSNPHKSNASFVHAWNHRASSCQTSMIPRLTCIVDIHTARNALLKTLCDNNLHRRDLVGIDDDFWVLLYSNGLGPTPCDIYCIRGYCYAKANSKEPGC